jgi:hypothetical protein
MPTSSLFGSVVLNLDNRQGADACTHAALDEVLREISGAASLNQTFSWRAMNSFTASRALSVWGPG